MKFSPPRKAYNKKEEEKKRYKLASQG